MDMQATTHERTEITDQILTSTDVRPKHFKHGMQFRLRSSKSVFTVEDLGDNILMCTAKDRESYSIHIQLKKTGIIFWQWIGGVEIKSVQIFYGNLILVKP